MASWTGWSRPSPGAIPSTVTTVSSWTAARGTRQLLIDSNRVRPCASVRRMATAQAPHSPSAHPSLVPVRPRARSHWRRVTLAPGVPAFTGRPFSTKATAMAKYTERLRRYNRGQMTRHDGLDRALASRGRSRSRSSSTAGPRAIRGISSRRVVRPDGVAPGTVLIAGERIEAVVPERRGAAGRDRRRRSGRLAGAGRRARPRQRAGPHRVGRLRHRDARGRGRRRHHHRRHAAQRLAR